tara:strand:+ start:798 stop:1100 length:303 start_codon:yes stop_codon:yes gene_type:complete
MAFKAFLETKGRKTGKIHKVELLVVRYNNRFYFSRRNPNGDWLKNAIDNPDVIVSFDGQTFPGKAKLVTDISLNKKICRLKYEDEKRANEDRIVLEVNSI